MENMTNEFKRQVLDALEILLATEIDNPISGPHPNADGSNKAGARKQHYIIRCEYVGCRKEAKMSRSDARFCSDACRKRDNIARKKAIEFVQASHREVIELIKQFA